MINVTLFDRPTIFKDDVNYKREENKRDLPFTEGIITV